MSFVAQEIVSSGLDYVVIRLGRTDVQDASFEKDTNVALGPQGSAPKQSKLTKGQVCLLVPSAIVFMMPF